MYCVKDMNEKEREEGMSEEWGEGDKTEHDSATGSSEAAAAFDARPSDGGYIDWKNLSELVACLFLIAS